MIPSYINGIQLRWYQIEAINSIWNYFNQGGRGNPLIALPTGTGKTIVIAGFIYSVLTSYAGQRILVLTHVKELVKQNYDKMLDIWPHAPVGINNAALGYRDTKSPCIIGSVQSVCKFAPEIGKIDLIIIDECHRVTSKEGSQYAELIRQCRATNPALKVIGLSATIYRQGIGLITNDEIFTDIIYDATDTRHFIRLIDEGFLAPLHVRKPDFQLDVSNVPIVAGEYNLKQLQNTVNVSNKVFEAVKETITIGSTYKSWLMFASGIEHAENLSRVLNECGVSAAALHNKVNKKSRDEIVNAHRNGELRCIVNKDILTTGYDNPQIDLISMIRPTRSTSLWVQMLGRGTRPAPQKTHCLVLDFAKNTERLGPIDAPVLPKPRGKKSGEMPVKVCGECGMYNNIRATQCYYCDTKFPIRETIQSKAGSKEVMSFVGQELPNVEVVEVDQVHYYKHDRKHPPSLRVSYRAGLRFFQEWVPVEHEKARGMAVQWWKERSADDLPDTVDEVLTMTDRLEVPSKLRVWTNKKPYPEILGYEF